MNASLHIQTALRDGKTYLKKAYHTTPFKVANITEGISKQELHLMLMSSSPGILDGDDYKIKVEVAESTSLQLQTQSYQRLFNMKESASQNMEVYMGKHSSFNYIPHPSVPHKASSFIAKNTIFLTEGCSLTWGEVLTCGRKLSGEQFTFSKYHNITEIYFNNRLIIKENLLMQPALVDVNALGQLEGYTHQATLIFVSNHVKVETAIAEVNQCLELPANICFGVSALQMNGIIVRLLGHKAEQLHMMLKQLAELLSKLKTLPIEDIGANKTSTYAI